MILSWSLSGGDAHGLCSPLPGRRPASQGMKHAKPPQPPQSDHAHCVRSRRGNRLGGEPPTGHGPGFHEAAQSVSGYSQAHIAPHMDCQALGQYTAQELLSITATAMPAAAAVPAHCRVTGMLAPEIAFEVSLPATLERTVLHDRQWGSCGGVAGGPHAGVAAQRCAAGRLCLCADQYRP